MAYLVPFPERKCGDCLKPAAYSLFNSYNAQCGHYCGPCGKRALKRLNSDEQHCATDVAANGGV